VLRIFSHLSIGIKSQNRTRMIFTDRNGNAWADHGAGSDRLVQLWGYEPPRSVDASGHGPDDGSGL